MPKTTRIKNVAWIVAWDPSTESHGYLNGGDLVFSGNSITFVGQNYTGEADETIDGADLMVMPGLIDIHSHPSTEPFFRGVREEHGLPSMYMTGLYERSFVFRPDEAGRQVGKEVAYCEMLLTGITTVADLSGNDPGWIDLAARSGLRVFLAPGYASARWHLENDWDLQYHWDEMSGRRGFDDALALIDQAARHPSGRLSGIVCPSQIDTCTEDLFRNLYQAATERGLPFTTHCAQSVNEFQEMVKRHGKTPVQWAKQIGILGPRTILGHAIFIDEHSWLHWHSHEDLGLLAESGTSVAHCPSPFARYGHGMEDFGRYRRAEVNIGIGTDVAPHNLIEEMRLAAVVARILSENIKTTSTAEVFRAATAGGAAALGRDDIGRLAVGAKADFVLVNLKNPFMMPARDPLRSLIYTAADRAIRDVYIAGTQVVREGKVLTLDHAGALEALTEAQQRMLSGARQRDYKGRSADEVMPLSLPTLAINNMLGPTSRIYFSQRLRLHYVDWGNPGAPPLLLVHGGRDHCRNWDWVAAALQDEYHVIAPDLRGHGDSQWSDSGHYTAANYIYDIAQLIHQRHLAPLRIIGHSLGGNISLRYTGIYPENVSHLVAIEGLGPGPKSHAEADRKPIAERMRSWIDEQRAYAARVPRRYATLEDAHQRMHEANAHLTTEQTRHLTEHGVNQNEDGTYSWKFDQYVRLWPAYDMTRDAIARLWSRIACPTLLVHGLDSWAKAPSNDGRIDYFQNARALPVAGAGHWVHHDQLDVFLGEVRAFLRNG